MEKVVVVILNYKVKDLTIKCVESVKESTYQDFTIIVVDNNSGEEIGDSLEKEIIFIQNHQNLGYTGGNNIGIKKALEIGADFVFVLNPDTLVDKKCLEILVQGMKKYQAAISGPKIYFAGSKKIWYAGGIFDRLNVIGSHRGVDEQDQGQYDQDQETDYITGAAMMVKREVFERIGLFDEDYFLYYEDSELCFRAKRAGFKIMYLPKAVVYHANAKSTGLGSALQDYFITRNRMLLASKFLSFRTRFALFREALKNLGNSARRLALFDFLIGNFGKGSFRL